MGGVSLVQVLILDDLVIHVFHSRDQFFRVEGAPSCALHPALIHAVKRSSHVRDGHEGSCIS